eukprot:TRINITY_DN11928_c0_g1_i1.p1 TRINITY_DN11928_c0_g1~~TRINITY_DN11928_c0_g1_i1.p1  ORF type:complete len:452 (-),score=79.77 TRINITY_DN11928_c0_g1_i1:74-1354(-)
MVASSTCLLLLVTLRGLSLAEGRWHDCESGDPSDWDSSKKEWCCERANIGCDSLDDTGGHQPLSEPFDCDADREVWQNSWSPAKQEWCCNHHPGGDKAGCGGAQATTTVHEVYVQANGRIYNCMDGLEDVQHLWDIDKQAHCCSQRGLGCPDNAFDCDSGYINWVHGWSTGKKIWCCARTNRGCPPTTITHTTTQTTTVTTTLSPCQQKCELSGSRVSCIERIHWTSKDTFLGEMSPCQMAHEQVLRECSVCSACQVSEACFGAANVPTSTKAPKGGSHEKVTTTQAVNAPFDCREGLEHWQQVWFPAKQDWCCDNMKLGCFTTSTVTHPPSPNQLQHRHHDEQDNGVEDDHTEDDDHEQHKDAVEDVETKYSFFRGAGLYRSTSQTSLALLALALAAAAALAVTLRLGRQLVVSESREERLLPVE